MDEALQVKAAQADPAQFSAIYLRYRVPIYRYLRSRTANDEDTIDLTQQVFLRAIEGLPRYRDRGLPFSAWLFRIARNTAVDAHRRARPSVPLDLVVAELTSDADKGPEASALRNEARARLETALSGLSLDQQELLVLRFGAELTMREIAQVVHRTEGAVKKQLGRALRLMKEQYDL
ncbi:MAG: RNA polymerase sigma factor [Chloroflexota bacterium]